MKRWTLILISIPFLGMATSCAVFNCRYKSWNHKVSRTPDGVLEFARAKTYGSGDTAVLMVHGFGDGPHVWNALAPELAARGFTVRAMRLPGWNEPMEVKRNTGPDDWEAAIVREAEALRDEHGRLVVMAHSLGGCLTTVLAQDGRLPADALILYAPMFAISNDRSPLLDTDTWFKIGDRILPDRMIIESLFPDHARRVKPRPKTRRDPFVPKTLYRGLYREMEVRAEQEPSISHPVRLVLPGEDRVVRSGVSRDWFEALEAPAKTLWTEEPAGHVLPLDVETLAEVDRIVIWLREQGIAP